MKNECSYVRDVLPLYFENMVSEDTAAFVEEHLKTCPGCFSELEAMRAETKTEKQDGVTARALGRRSAELDEGHTQEAAPEGVPDSRDNRRDFHSFLRVAVLFPGLSCP